MATVINNPDTSTDRGGNGAMIVGIVLAVILLFMFFYYGLPALRGNNGGTNVNVPDRVDLNVNGNTGTGAQ